MELSAADAGQHGGARAARGQRGAAQAQRPDAAARCRQFEQAFGELGPAGLVSNLLIGHTRPTVDRRAAHRLRLIYRVGRGRRRDVPGRRRSGCIDAGLELGGKDPAYVAADADLDFVVPNIVERRLL